MPRRKKVIYYTHPDYADTLLIPIESRSDTTEAREQALEEIMRRMDDESDTTITPDSFSDGLGLDQLVIVEPPQSQKTTGKRKSRKGLDRELQPVEIAAQEIAQFSLLRVELQKHQEAAQPYLEVIEALFKPDPLTDEQIEVAQSKDFAKTLSNLATAKVEFDAFQTKAEQAWEVLKPVVSGKDKNGKR